MSWRTVEDHELSRGCPGYVEVGLVVGFFLHQFSAVLKLRDANGRPYVLIGGQAVNYWAERYAFHVCEGS